MMKKRLFSFFEISINGQDVGFSSMAYHRQTASSESTTISAELLLSEAFRLVEGIQLAVEWPLYGEQSYVGAPGHDETLTRSLLRKAICNYAAYAIQLERKRDIFELEFNVEGKQHKYLLFHEFLFQPPYKQVQSLPDNKISRFPIHMEDAAILNELRARQEKV